MKWLREAISDDQGFADMAYICIGALAASAIGALTFIFAMSVVSYVRCTHIVDVGEGVRAAVACTFDPLPVGQAAGLVFGAFAALIGSLAGYMAATKRSPRVVTTTTTQATTVAQTMAAPAADVQQVEIVPQQHPVPVRVAPPAKRAAKKTTRRRP